MKNMALKWIGVRRLLFVSLVAATIALMAWQTLLMLQINGLTGLKLVIFLLFVALLIPIALSFWTAVIGFVSQWRGRDELDVTRNLQDVKPGLPLPRTAIIMPVFNEEPTRVFAGLKATYESLAKTGLLSSFDFFVLSDTIDPDVWVREEVAFAELKSEVREPERLIYRNRRENLERKTGNIADFCETWGGRYTYMIVLDADSIMTGTTIVNLVLLMEKHTKAGIIQAPPLPVNRQTLFGRLHQFATHAYSLLFTTGLNFWQGGEGNYWGHNAIIRIAPFVTHCRLPKLSGKEPLGGSILSHDFVEAAYMRRAGWKVYMATELGGSYEEMPSSLIGYAARDRRWCQGNMQHIRLLLTPRLHLVNRLHIGLGVMSYVASPLWLLLLGLATIEGIREVLGPHSYFSLGKSLFPDWQISVQSHAILLFIVMMSLLLLPKVLAAILLVHQPERLAGFGGARKVALSVLCETLFSSLLAPNLALLQTRFVVGTLLGKKIKWDAQDRGDEPTSFDEAVRRHWPSTLIGLLWSLLLLFTVPNLFWWFSPVLLGFLLAIPISALSSRSSLGSWSKKCGLFLTPEEINPPEILQRLHQELARAPSRAWAAARDGLAWICEDPYAREIHLGLLNGPSEPMNPIKQNHYEGLELKTCLEGFHALTVQEKRELLLNPDSIKALTRKFDEHQCEMQSTVVPG